MDTKIKQLLKTIKLNESMLSMFFGVVTVLLIGILIFRMYRTNVPATITEQADQTVMSEKVGNVEVEKMEDGTKVPKELAEKITVEKGEHLWMLAEKHYGSGYNYVDIAKANNLDTSKPLAVGQELVLPKVAVIELATETVAATPTPEVMVDNKIEGDSYKVVKGDYLWDIAVRAYGDGYKWTQIAKDNSITHPDYIEVGLELKLTR